MDRDVLLLLLTGGVLLNLALLVLVALIRSAPWRGSSTQHRWAQPRGGSVRAAAAPRQVSAVAAAPRQVSAAATPVAVMPVADVPAPASAAAPLAPAIGPAPAAMPAPAASPTPAVTLATATAPAPAETSVATSIVATPPASPAQAAAPARRPTAPKPVRRPRRFTMPDLEEDHERAARSIAAFLGEPLAPSAGARPHRRRHRARRPAGTSPRSDLVLVLRGERVPARVTRAVASALRDTVRESDEVVELQGGRLRVTLDADSAGSEAFLVRARGVVRPWLELVGPSIELGVEDPAASPAAASAAS